MWKLWILDSYACLVLIAADWAGATIELLYFRAIIRAFSDKDSICAVAVCRAVWRKVSGEGITVKTQGANLP